MNILPATSPMSRWMGLMMKIIKSNSYHKRGVVNMEPTKELAVKETNPEVDVGLSANEPNMLNSRAPTLV